jgi:uncharacterized protein (DUF2141 family)
MTKTFLFSIFLTFCFFIKINNGALASEFVVQIEITDIKNTNGDLSCSLFSSKEGYPEDHSKAYQNIHVKIDSNQAICEFKNIAPGTYAAIILHDENKNGKIDKNFVGIPQEGYASSNDERPRFSAPRFKEASFKVSPFVVTKIKVKMGY